MSLREIDWTGDKAIVSPVYNGAAYKQGGRYYGQDGLRVMMPGEVDVEPKQARKTQQPAPDRTEQPRRGKTRAKKDTGPPRPEAQSGKKGSASVVDLSAWAHRTQTYLFGHVRKAVQAKYSNVPGSERGAIDILVAENVITLEAAAKAWPEMNLMGEKG